MVVGVWGDGDNVDRGVTVWVAEHFVDEEDARGICRRAGHLHGACLPEVLPGCEWGEFGEDGVTPEGVPRCPIEGIGTQEWSPRFCAGRRDLCSGGSCF